MIMQKLIFKITSYGLHEGFGEQEFDWVNNTDQTTYTPDTSTDVFLLG